MSTDSPSEAPQNPMRKRRNRRRRRKAFGPIRPGAFFRPAQGMINLRDGMSPFNLGDADWLVFQRSLNPYPTGTYKARHYDAGFKSSKQKTPNPNWRPL